MKTIIIVLMHFLHDVIAHPLLFITYWPYRFADWLHDLGGDYLEKHFDPKK